MSRVAKNRLFITCTWCAFTLCVLVLVFLVGNIAIRGARAISLDFLLTEARQAGASGGIFYQIVGSALMVTFTALIAFPLAVGTAVYQSEYARQTWVGRLTDAAIFALNGVPSIVFGLFGLIALVNVLGLGISWFVGSVVLAVMIMPTVVVATVQAMESLPTNYRQTASALGLTQWQTVTSVVLPQAMHGAVTGLLLGIARAVGETAPIMFIATAVSGARVPTSFFEPVVTLPTHILELSQNAVLPQALANAWGASLVLFVIVCIFSGASLWARIRWRRAAVR